jgi:hypothetical protein
MGLEFQANGQPASMALATRMDVVWLHASVLTAELDGLEFLIKMNKNSYLRNIYDVESR